MKILIRIVKISLLVVVTGLIVNACLIFGMAKWQPKFESADSAIVLGAAINTPALTNRTTQALSLYLEDKVNLLVLSGGKISDADISEAEFMEKVIKRFSDEPVKYILEEDSHTTYENIRNSKQKLAEAGIDTSKPVVVVSDEFHLARAVLMAKRAGFETVYWSAPVPDYYSAEDLRFYYFREFIAMLNYIPKFIFG